MTGGRVNKRNTQKRKCLKAGRMKAKTVVVRFTKQKKEKVKFGAGHGRKERFKALLNIYSGRKGVATMHRLRPFCLQDKTN